MLLVKYNDQWWRADYLTNEKRFIDGYIIQHADVVVNNETREVIKDRYSNFNIAELDALLLKQWTTGVALMELPNLTEFTVARLERGIDMGILS